MKDVSNMEGPIAGHYGEELKLGRINWYHDLVFPNFTLFYQGMKDDLHQFILNPRLNDVDIALSSTPGPHNPVTVEFPVEYSKPPEKSKLTISARPSDSSSSDEIILKVERGV